VKIIGCDLHARQQTLAMLDSVTGEVVNATLKTRLAEAITKIVMEILHYEDESVSVAMEEIKSQDWLEKVYKPDIKDKWDKLYKKPGYIENDL
jgi:4-oxalocrotonate tautomerase